jgi:hypothetical protein
VGYRLDASGVALLMALGAGCGARAPSPSAPSTRSPPVAASASAPPKTAPAERREAVDLVVAEALAVVARARQLPARGPVRGQLVTRDEMLAVVRDQIRDELPTRVVEAQEELLFGLGLVPEDFDYMGSLFSLMAEQLAGLYEPKSKRMILSEDLGDSERRAALAHELVHALQDQHYELGRRMLQRRPGDGDEQSALQTLAEGDATSAMLDVLGARPATELDDGALSWELRGMVALGGNTAVPDILRRSLVAPYADGVLLVHALRRKGGWASVDEVWRLPPASTEQVLHPEKLAAREAPEPVPAPEPPDKSGWELLDADVMGEQSVRQVFEEWMPRQKAVDSAADWGGDHMATYRRGDEYAIGWQVRYDTARAAERGLLAFARGVLASTKSAEQKPGGMVPEAEARRAISSGRVCRERPTRGPFAVARAGRTVMVVIGPYRRAKGDFRSTADCGAAVDRARRVLADVAP